MVGCQGGPVLAHRARAPLRRQHHHHLNAYIHMGMVMMLKKGGARALADDRISHHPFINLSAEAVQLSPEMRDGAMGREHGEYKRDKVRRCSRLVRPLGDRRRDMLQLHSAAASRSPRAPGPRPACAGRSPRAGA
jgi:hypothetical protein